MFTGRDVVTMSKRIGLFGGTFDPIHFGHLRTAWEVYHATQLDEVRFIPCFSPPHRTPPVASPEERFSMVQRAIASVPYFIADDCELRRSGTSYTVDTLRSLSRELPDHSLCLIIGSDAFVHFETWHDWEEIVKLANVIVMERPGHRDSVSRELKQKFRLVEEVNDLHEQASGALFIQTVTLLGISSTRIRDEISRTGYAPFLLPEETQEYITQQKLYSLF